MKESKIKTFKWKIKTKEEKYNKNMMLLLMPSAVKVARTGWCWRYFLKLINNNNAGSGGFDWWIWDSFGQMIGRSVGWLVNAILRRRYSQDVVSLSQSLFSLNSLLPICLSAAVHYYQRVKRYSYHRLCAHSSDAMKLT